MARNMTHLRSAVAKALECAEEVRDAKQEAIDNCESDSRLEKLEEQLEVLERILESIQEAQDAVDEYES